MHKQVCKFARTSRRQILRLCSTNTPPQQFNSKTLTKTPTRTLITDTITRTIIRNNASTTQRKIHCSLTLLLETSSGMRNRSLYASRTAEYSCTGWPICYYTLYGNENMYLFVLEHVYVRAPTCSYMLVWHAKRAGAFPVTYKFDIWFHTIA